MRGYPKNLNSKQDYEYVKKYFPKYEWIRDFQKLKDDNKKWIKEERLVKKEDGIIDITSKVIEEENEKQEKTYYQYRFKIDPNSKANRLRIELNDVDEILIEN